MGLRGYFVLFLKLIVFVKYASTTCAINESTGSAKCYSLKEVESLQQKADGIISLEIECNKTGELEKELGFGFDNLVSLSIRQCANVTSQLGFLRPKNLKTLDLAGNNISVVPWKDLRNTARDVVNLKENLLSCDCDNLWLVERVDKRRGLRGWDPHMVAGLPLTVKVDAKVTECDFGGCKKEKIEFEEVPGRGTTGQHAHGQEVVVACRLSATSPIRNGSEFGEFIWLLRDSPAADANNTNENNNDTDQHQKTTFTDNLMTMRINSLTSNELGYLACICTDCYYPAFAVNEIKFATNISVNLFKDDIYSHLIVHGYPINVLSLKITKLSDNLTESIKFSLEDEKNDQKFTLFNETMTIKHEASHSFFFTKYFTIFTQECTLCPPESAAHLDGEYTMDICRDDECVTAVGRFTNDHPVITPTSGDDDEGNSSAKYLIIPLLILIVFLVVILSKTHLKNKLLKKGWEIKRRRTSRNTDRTEETSIRLEDYSASTSLNYIVQHVPLIDKDALEIRNRIGKGAFGEVHRAEWGQEGQKVTTVAVKMLFGVQLDSELDKEASLLSQLDHPNIVKLFGICKFDAQIALVMELMNLGDLKSYVRERTPRCDNYSQFPPPLFETELLNIAAQVAAGLTYLNSQQVVHRDLAARNCLVQGETDLKICNAAFRKPITVKISDFGMSRRLYSDGEYYKMQNGKTVLPVRWLPPECLSSGKFTHQSDMWSFGMVLFEIFSYGAIPFGDLSNSEVLTAVVSGMKPSLPSSFPEPINNLISQCWRNSPEERITSFEALNRLQILL